MDQVADQGVGQVVEKSGRRRLRLPRALMGAAGLVAGVGLIGVWLATLDVPAMLVHLRAVDPWWLALGTAAVPASWFVRSQRWRAIIAPVQPLGRGEAYEMTVVATACNVFLPVRAGELAVGASVGRRHRLPMALVVSTLALDKVCDLLPALALLALGSLAIGAIPGEVWGLAAAGFALALASLVALVLIVRHDRTIQRQTEQSVSARGLEGALPAWAARPVLQRATTLLSGLALIARHPSSRWPVVLLTLGATALDVFSFYGTLRAFDVVLPLAALSFGATLVMLSMMVPGPPGRLGSYELAMLLVFNGLLGLPRDLVAAHAAVRHLVMLALTALAGATVFLWLGRGVLAGRPAVSAATRPALAVDGPAAEVASSGDG